MILKMRARVATDIAVSPVVAQTFLVRFLQTLLIRFYSTFSSVRFCDSTLLIISSRSCIPFCLFRII